MRFVQLKAHIKQGKFLPCYAACGDDPYLIRRAKEMFCSAFSVFPEFNITVCDDADAARVVQTASTMPLMSDYRLIIAPIAVLKDLAAYLKAPCLSAVIFLYGAAKPSLTGLVNVEAVDCDRLEPDLVNSFIGIECASRNCAIEPAASALLAEHCARFAGRITGELDKLAAYRLNGVINCDDVRLNVTPALEYRVFELSDAIVKKDAKKATAILDDMLAQSGAAAKVFGLIYSHFRRLMYAALSPDEKELMNAFGIKEFAARAVINQSRAFPKPRLKYFLDKLHQADIVIKNMAADKAVLSSFIYEVMSP